MTMAEVNAYEYAIIVSRSVQAKVSCLLCTLSDYIFILTWVFLCLVYLQGYPTPQLTGEQKWIPTFFRYVVNLNITYFRLNRVFEGTYWRDFYLIKILDYLLLTDNYFICLKLIDIKKLMFILIILLT